MRVRHAGSGCGQHGRRREPPLPHPSLVCAARFAPLHISPCPVPKKGCAEAHQRRWGCLSRCERRPRGRREGAPVRVRVEITQRLLKIQPIMGFIIPRHSFSIIFRPAPTVVHTGKHFAAVHPVVCGRAVHSAEGAPDHDRPSLTTLAAIWRALSSTARLLAHCFAPIRVGKSQRDKEKRDQTSAWRANITTGQNRHAATGRAGCRGVARTGWPRPSRLWQGRRHVPLVSVAPAGIHRQSTGEYHWHCHGPTTDLWRNCSPESSQSDPPRTQFPGGARPSALAGHGGRDIAHTWGRTTPVRGSITPGQRRRWRNASQPRFAAAPLTSVLEKLERHRGPRCVSGPTATPAGAPPNHIVAASAQGRVARVLGAAPFGGCERGGGDDRWVAQGVNEEGLRGAGRGGGAIPGRGADWLARRAGENAPTSSPPSGLSRSSSEGGRDRSCFRVCAVDAPGRVGGGAVYFVFSRPLSGKEGAERVQA